MIKLKRKIYESYLFFNCSIKHKQLLNKFSIKKVTVYLDLKGMAMDTHSAVNHARAISDQQSRKHVKPIRERQF